MILPLIHVRDIECCPEAIGQTTRGGNYYLLGMSGDGLEGIITNRHPMQFLCVSPLSLLMNSENNRFIEGSANVRSESRDLIGLLFRKEKSQSGPPGSQPGYAADRLRPVLEPAEKLYGQTHLPCYWVALEHARRGKNSSQRGSRPKRV
jgi:hypothetical protein